jgi:surface carbohydrate biosynthesis protein (TIGR04326 family)
VTSLTIWADDDPPTANSGPVALWQAFLPDDAPKDWYSLPDEVHRNRDGLRRDYLAWLHEAGVTTVRGVHLVDRMAIRPGLSYWWMTIPADNSIESNSPAYIAVRLMALAALADRLAVTSVKIVTSDRSLARLLRDWAKATGRPYELLLGPRPRITRESLYRALPIFAALRVIIGHAGIPRRVKRGPDEPASGHGQTGICLVDYLAHFSPGAVEEGRFASNYWGPLVQVLDEPHEPVRWLHISAELASTGVVAGDDHLVGRFDEHAAKQTHDLLHRHLTWAVLIRSCRDYLRVRWFGLTARPRARLFADASSGTSMWQAFRTAYRDQFFGKTGMLNCLWLNLFEEACVRMPPQRLGIYLFENQPWEMAFIHAWRRAGHGELIGVAHTTTRFWDTRYFKDLRDLWSTQSVNAMPWPERVAVNGSMMLMSCVQAGYPTCRLAQLDALRFRSLPHDDQEQVQRDQDRILVLGEYSLVSTNRLLRLVSQAISFSDHVVKPVFRPHPTQWANAHPPGFERDRAPTVQDAIRASGMTICGAGSSVALDSALLGVMTLIVVDPAAFASSPAEGLSSTFLAFTVDDINRYIEGGRAHRASAGLSPSRQLMIGGTLGAWRRQISVHTTPCESRAFRGTS